MQNKRTFASRFFELFTLPANLKLNTQRRSAPSMCAFKEEERSVLISVTLMKGITGYKITVSTIGITVCKWRIQLSDSDLKERFLSLIVCLFIYFFFCHPHFSFFFFLLFLLSAFFFPSAFFHPHFPIRILHPQVSGPRFTDTHFSGLGNEIHKFHNFPGFPWPVRTLLALIPTSLCSLYLTCYKTYVSLR